MKLYFDNADEGVCNPLSHYKEILEDGDTMELWEGVREIGEDHFWCSEFQEIGIKSESECGSSCSGYSPTNGKSGRCRHSKNTYFPADKYILERHGKKFNFKKVEDEKGKS